MGGDDDIGLEDNEGLLSSRFLLSLLMAIGCLLRTCVLIKEGIPFVSTCKHCVYRSQRQQCVHKVIAIETSHKCKH